MTMASKDVGRWHLNEDSGGEAVKDFSVYLLIFFGDDLLHGPQLDLNLQKSLLP